jgi:hypothetical protein
MGQEKERLQVKLLRAHLGRRKADNTEGRLMLTNARDAEKMPIDDV